MKIKISNNPLQGTEVDFGQKFSWNGPQRFLFIAMNNFSDNKETNGWAGVIWFPIVVTDYVTRLN